MNTISSRSFLTSQASSIPDEIDSDYPTPITGQKGLRFNSSDITKLRYDSNVAQYNNWLIDLKAAFDGDPAKFPTGRHKVILASMTIDEQLKTTYNSAAQAQPAISSHWRKFRHWIKDMVLHGDSDRLKLSNEFTTARQRVNEDPNQFYLRLFNLGIQSGRAVNIEDYRTRLVRPLQNVINQQDRAYTTVQDAVAHAGRLWQTLDPERVRQEIKDERARRQRQSGSGQSDRQQPRPGGQDQSRRPRTADDSKRPQQGRQGGRRRLSDEEHQHRLDKNLCYNCGYPNHSTRDCNYPFNPNRAPLRNQDNDPVETPPSRGQKRPYAKAQPTRAFEDDSDADRTGSATRAGASDYDSDSAAKRSKN